MLAPRTGASGSLESPNNRATTAAVGFLHQPRFTRQRIKAVRARIRLERLDSFCGRDRYAIQSSLRVSLMCQRGWPALCEPGCFGTLQCRAPVLHISDMKFAALDLLRDRDMDSQDLVSLIACPRAAAHEHATGQRLSIQMALDLKQPPNASLNSTVTLLAPGWNR